MNRHRSRKIEALLALVLCADARAASQGSLEHAAMAHLESNRLPEAEAALLTLTRNSPGNPAYWNILGVVHERMDRHEQAAADFQQAIRLDASSASAHYNLALNFLQRKMPAEAAAELETTLKLDPALASAHYNLGTLYAGKGRLPAAIEHMAAAHRLEPTNYEAAYRLAELQYHSRDYAAALETLQNAVPPSARAGARSYLEGLCYSAMGKAEPAILSLRMAVDLAPGNADYLYDYGIMLVNGQQDARALTVFRDAAARFPQVSKIHFGHALASYLNGRNEEAEAAMALAIQLDPRPAEMWMSLGDIYAGLGRKQDALAAYRKSESLGPAASAIYRKQGVVLDQMDDFAAARQAFQRALSIDPADSAAQYGLAKISLRMQHFERALADFEKTVQMDPQNAAAYYQLSLLYRRAGQAAKAEQALAAFKKSRGVSVQAEETVDSLLEAVRQRPADDNAWTRLADELARKEEYSTAIKLLQGYVNAAPTAPLAHLLLGQAYYNHGEFDKALAAFRRAAELDPASSRARYSAGVARLAMGNSDAARAEFERSLAMDPRNLMAHLRLGEMQMGAGHLAAARTEFETSIRLNPLYHQSHFRLGQLLAKTGRIEEAIHEFETALQLNPDNRSARYQLAAAYRKAGRTGDAARQYELVKTASGRDVQKDIDRMSVWTAPSPP